MSKMFDGFKVLATTYKDFGGTFLKTTAIELWLEQNHDDLIERLSMALQFIKPEDVPRFVKGEMALPIPPPFFQYLQGFADFIETFEPERLFQWIAEANPLIAAAIMDQGEKGAIYMVRFKQFVVDSVKALEPPIEQIQENPATEVTPSPADEIEEHPAARPPVLRVRVATAEPEKSVSLAPAEPIEQPPTETKAKRGRKKLTCDSCGKSFPATAEDAAKITHCPFCGEPA